ncbi:Copper-exporting P-type ATPase B [uncultured archaeon]|nr:Copper-exporting P-type ATPase B [uncultured archaeon]
MVISEESEGKENYWTTSSNQVVKIFESSESQGLTSEEATKRQKIYGLNTIPEDRGRTILQLISSQLKNWFMIILLIAAITAYYLGSKTESMIILLIVLVSGLLGFVQEYRAEKTVQELKKYIARKTRVIRNGAVIEIDSREVVPGDIIHLSVGDIVPADLRLIEIENLSVDESALTGESFPVEKETSQISTKSVAVQNLSNIIFMGTSVVQGKCVGIVVETGEKTYFGKTAKYIEKKVPEEEFQRGIRKFSNLLMKVVVSMTIFIFLANALLQKPLLDSLLFALALAVGVTPEILPVIITIALSRGAMRMAKESVIIKRLSSMEDFGNIDTLCSDKTGTLTEGKMSFMEGLNFDGEKEEKLILDGLLCNAKAKDRLSSANNPIDSAIWESSKSHHLAEKFAQYKIVEENEFDFERKRMSVIVEKDRHLRLIVKGAPESILRVCKYVKFERKNQALSSALMKKIKSKIESYENEGYKVILLAEKNFINAKKGKEIETSLVLCGLLLFIDPPKKTAKEAIENLEKLNVSLKILTGDGEIVTRKICSEVGFNIKGKIFSGEELSKLDHANFEKYCRECNVFVRLTPEQKYRIVKVLNREGHIVGFLGDGINDAPALRAADVGISVNTASDIAKDSAEIILLHKSLRVLGNGIVEGRKTFGNVTKYITNTISANYGNMFTVASSSLFLNFIPLLPSQILLNNFLSDVPNLTLPADNVDKEYLIKPKRWDIKFLSRFMIYFGLLSSFFDLMLIIPLLLVFKAGPEVFRTAWFVESAISEIIVVFAIRTKLPFYLGKPKTSLLMSSLISILFCVLITIWAFGRQIFNFTALSSGVWILIAIVLTVYFASAEIAKRSFFKKIEF